MSDTGAGDAGDNSDNTALFYKYAPSHYMGQGQGELQGDPLDRVLSSVYEQPSTDKIEGNINNKFQHELRAPESVNVNIVNDSFHPHHVYFQSQHMTTSSSMNKDPTIHLGTKIIF